MSSLRLPIGRVLRRVQPTARGRAASPWRLVALVLVACLALLPPAGACTSPARGIEGPAPGATAAPPDDRESFRVGAVISLSGRFSREGLLMRDGYETWAQAANELGGVEVAGTRRRVRLVVYDDESEPLQAARMVEKLVRDEDTRFVLGPFSAPITLAAATAAERLGALTVAPDASAASVFARGLQMLVSVLPVEDRYFEGLIALAERVGPTPRRVGLLIPDEPFFVAAARGAAERGGTGSLPPVTVERFPADARDVSGSLAELAQLRPTLLAVAGQPEQLGLFLPQLRELAPMATLRAATPGPPLRDLPSGLRNGPDGLLTVDWWSPGLAASGPVLGSAREFAARFQRDHGYPPDARAASAAAAGLALQLGIERARAVEPPAVRSALAGLDAATFWGRLAWDAAGRNRGAIVPVLQFSGGRPRVVYPEPFAEAPLRVPGRDTPTLGD